MDKAPWWKDEVIYQIYPMSFCDSNGDGIGDIKGIISKLDYLKELGVGALWLSPVYASPNEDNGYDISDYCAIHENYGTMDDMDALILEAKRRGLRIIMDLVINHTSNQHEWFQKSRQRIEPYTDYYIWQKGENGQKPSNWGSFFGEDCWEYDELRQEYYLHLFAKGQPDLNYHNEAVINAVEDVMRFWLEKGVAGFRCDVINILWKNSLANGRPRIALTGCEHYISTDGLHTLLSRFNSEVFSKYDCYTVGETVFVTPKMADDLVNPQRKELDTIFSFEHMETDCFGVKWLLRDYSPDRFIKTLFNWQTSLDWNTLYFENHDQPRSVSRFGDDEQFHYISAKALATLLLTLRGTAFIYEGQELGMTNFDYSGMEEVKDVESQNIWALTERLHLPKTLRWKMISTKSRDNARTPMQWTSGQNGGFSSGTPWLKPNSNYTYINAKDQTDDKNSILSYYKKLLSLRKSSEALRKGSFKTVYCRGGVAVFERETDGEKLCTVINLTAHRRPSPVCGRALISNYSRRIVGGTLKPYEAAVLKL